MFAANTPRTERLMDHAAWFVPRGAMPLAVPAPLGELLHAIDGQPQTAAPEPGFTVPVWRVRTGGVLLREAAYPVCAYVVRSGTFKCLKTLEDGYEQVLAFAARGEVLGFEAVSRGRYTASVVALEDSTVFALPLHDLDAWRRRSPALDHALQFALSRQLARAGEIAEMMAAVAAEVRLARFLIWLSGDMAERGQSPRRLHLRMSRRDIASLLGVAHETVSRSFTTLAESGYLRVGNRDVEILDVDGLRSCTRNTRGLPDDPPRGVAAPARRRPAARLGAVA